MKKRLIGRRPGKEIFTPRAEDPFEVLQRSIDRVFDEFRRSPGLEFPFGFAGARAVEVQMPRLDVSETKDEVQVIAELPGMDEKNVEVTLGNHTLTIRGEKITESEDKDKDYHVMERVSGHFHRVITLPDGLDADKAKAEFKKGVLTVKIPKTQEAKEAVRKIAVQAA